MVPYRHHPEGSSARNPMAAREGASPPLRRRLSILVGLAASLIAGFPARAQAAAPTFEGAKWIWFSREPMPITTAQSFVGGACYFRTAATLPDPAQLASAEVLVTADNLWSLYLNGHLVGESRADHSAWGSPKRFEVKHLLVGGTERPGSRGDQHHAGSGGSDPETHRHAGPPAPRPPPPPPW
jgi:hypothetical protein